MVLDEELITEEDAEQDNFYGFKKLRKDVLGLGIGEVSRKLTHCHRFSQLVGKGGRQNLWPGGQTVKSNLCRKLRG